MKPSTFSVVERPPTHGRYGALTEAYQDTLDSNTAVSFPLNGEPGELVRNNKIGPAYRVARRLNARVRTAISADGQALCIWLEPKTKERDL